MARAAMLMEKISYASVKKPTPATRQALTCTHEKDASSISARAARLRSPAVLAKGWAVLSLNSVEFAKSDMARKFVVSPMQAFSVLHVSLIHRSNNFLICIKP